MAEKVTRLAYIMSRLGVRAEEVSKRTGIDKTLISRWKSGQRRLSPVSAYSKQISSYLLSLDNAESIINKTLNAYGLDENRGSLQDNFIFWLAEQELPSPSLRNAVSMADNSEYTASFRVFQGNSGLRSAIITMIDYVMTLPGPQNIVAVALSDFNWVTADPAFFNLLVERLSVAFTRGVTLTMVSRENFTDDMARFSGLWLAAHLKGYIKSYYYREDAAEAEEKVFISVKDGVCLCLKHDSNVADGLYAAMYTDNITVQHIYHECTEYLTRANTQFRYGFFDEPGSFLNDIDNEKLLAADAYVCSAVPSLGAINYRQAHLYARDTLRDTKQRTEQVKALFFTPNQFIPAAKMRHIYCLESIDNLLSPGRTVDYPLSVIYGKRIHHSHKRVMEQLEHIRDWLRANENFEVALAPAHVFEQIPLEFICARNNLCVAWIADSAVSTCVKDQNKVESLFGYASQLWERLPKYCKDRHHTIRQLNQWLASEGK